MLMHGQKRFHLSRGARKSKILSVQSGVVLQTKPVYLIAELSPHPELRVTLFPSRREFRNHSSADSGLLKRITEWLRLPLLSGSVRAKSPPKHHKRGLVPVMRSRGLGGMLDFEGRRDRSGKFSIYAVTRRTADFYTQVVLSRSSQ